MKFFDYLIFESKTRAFLSGALRGVPFLQAGSLPYPRILDKPEKAASDQHSSLFCLSLSDEENKL
jgi:hypothetical protein